jgi:predicted metallo-beta-lactamase superfamily hydrolase
MEAQYEKMACEIEKLTNSKQKYKKQIVLLKENFVEVENSQSIRLENTYLLRKINALEREV